MAAKERTTQPYVAFSCGKDSAVAAHLARLVWPGAPLRLLCWDETALLGDFADVCSAWVERGARVEAITLHRRALDEKIHNRWQALTQGADGFVAGLRADESRGRRMSLATHGPLYQAASGLWRVCPVAWFTTVDIAAYILEHDLPILDSYTHDGIMSRTSARVPREEVRDLAIGSLRRRDPAAFNALCAIYPELALIG